MDGAVHIHREYTDIISYVDILNINRSRIGGLDMLGHGAGTGLLLGLRKLLIESSSFLLHLTHIRRVCLHLTELSDGLIRFILSLL